MRRGNPSIGEWAALAAAVLGAAVLLVYLFWDGPSDGPVDAREAEVRRLAALLVEADQHFQCPPKIDNDRMVSDMLDVASTPDVSLIREAAVRTGLGDGDPLISLLIALTFEEPESGWKVGSGRVGAWQLDRKGRLNPPPACIGFAGTMSGIDGLDEAIASAKRRDLRPYASQMLNRG